MKGEQYHEHLTGYLIMSVAICLANLSTSYCQANNPVMFQPGILSTGEYETHPAFSPDGETLYFLKCTPDINNLCVICISVFKDGKWTQPAIAPFSGRYMDIDPFVTADGKHLYFCSNRPVVKGGQPKADTDIWRIPILKGGGYGEPMHVEGRINSDYDEYYPTLADNGNLYFGSTRNGSDSDIFVSRYINGKFDDPENLGDSVNSSWHEYEPFIASDESFLLFMATVPAGLNNADFYISYNTSGNWSKAVELPEPINSSGTEWSPKITHDKKYFFFSSTRSLQTQSDKQLSMEDLKKKLNSAGNGLGDLYFLDAGLILEGKFH